MIGNYIKAAAVAVSRSTAKLMKTGQTTSYRTGDDGDIEAGRNTSFTVLAENNPFGNTNRFTDELGGQTYTNNIVIDWSTYDGSTVLGYKRRILNNGVTTDFTWPNAIDLALSHSTGIYTSGWRLPNVYEINNIANYGISGGFNYAPFSNASGGLIVGYNIWTSTSYAVSPVNNAIAYPASSNYITFFNKTTPLQLIAVRVFTVTGTTLS